MNRYALIGATLLAITPAHSAGADNSTLQPAGTPNVSSPPIQSAAAQPTPPADATVACDDGLGEGRRLDPDEWNFQWRWLSFAWPSEALERCCYVAKYDLYTLQPRWLCLIGTGWEPGTIVPSVFCVGKERPVCCDFTHKGERYYVTTTAAVCKEMSGTERDAQLCRDAELNFLADQ